MLGKTFSAILVLGALSTAASAQIPNVGATVGLYFPTSSEMRDAFGNSILRFGFGDAARSKTGNIKFGTAFDIITANKNGNRLLLVPVTFEAEQQLTLNPAATTRPYVKAFAGIAYMDYGITMGGTRYDDKLIRTTIGAELGIVFAERFRLSARYNAFPKASGFDFSGMSVNLTFNLMP
jgi:hypothetical protein